jgi:exonuclease SbcC
MQILSIHLKNIKSHHDTELSFAPGINVLSGPNGAGKSTVFEAIGYALFGVDARDFVSNVDRFLTIGAKKGDISVTFATDAGETWRVNRTVGTPAKWLLAKEAGGVFEVEEHAKIEETEARIAELLGLDNGRPLAEQFKLVIGPFQNEFLGPFVIKQATRRQEAFDEILGIDAWRKTFKGTSALIATVQEKIKVLAAEVEAKEAQVAVLPDREAELVALKGEADIRRKALTEKSAALQEIEKRLAAFDVQEKRIAAVRTDIQVLENRVKDGEGKIADQKRRVTEAEKARDVLEQTRAGKEAFEKAEAMLVELRLKEQQRRGVEQEITALDTEALRLTQNLHHERHEIEAANKQLTEEEQKLAETRTSLEPDGKLVAVAACLPDLRREAETLRSTRGLFEGRRASLMEGREKLAEGICPYFQEPCRNIAGKPPRDVFTTRVEELDREMLDLDKRIEERGREICTAEKAQQELDAVRVRTEELEKQSRALAERNRKNLERAASLDALAKQQAEAATRAAARKVDLKAFTGLDQEIARLDTERAGLQVARDAFQANQKDAEDSENRRQALEKMLKLLLTLQQELAARGKELTGLRETYLPEVHQEARTEKDRLVAEVATLRQQITDMEQNSTRLENEIVKLLEQKKDIEARLAEKGAFEEKEKLVRFLRNQVFKNVSAQLSERFREEISLRADRIYRTIAETDEELIWGDDYRIVLRDMADGQVRERSDDQLSGGQTMSAVVALRLALLQTIGARIAFFDEPTSNLDVSRRENLAHAFRAIDVGREEVTEHWYDQLFLISHDVAFTEITDQTLQLGDSDPLPVEIRK